MKLKAFVIILLAMMVLAIGINTRNIDALLYPPQIAQDTEIIAEAMKSVVMVVHPDIPFPASGFYIGNGIIVTAGHVAEMDGLEKVIFEDGSEFEVLKQIVNPNCDCGLLIIENVNRPALKFDDEQIERGNIVYILGNPYGYTFVVSKGIMSGNDDCDGYFGDTILLVYDIESAGGSSGSPVIDDEGEIVAVHVGSNGTGYNVGVYKDDILNTLEQMNLEL